jgi:ferredoxin
LREAKNKGLVKAIGVSTHHVDVAKMCADIPDIDVIFPLINFKSLGIRDKTNPGSKEDMAAAIELCSNNGKGVFAMKVLGGGNLIGEYIQALDYVSGLPGIASMMIGFGSRDEIDRAIEYAEGAIDRNYAPGTSGRRIRIIEGDCVGCGACAERCPSIAISRSTPGLFEINHSLCVACGYCAPVCPVNAIITL